MKLGDYVIAPDFVDREHEGIITYKNRGILHILTLNEGPLRTLVCKEDGARITSTEGMDAETLQLHKAAKQWLVSRDFL